MNKILLIVLFITFTISGFGNYTSSEEIVEYNNSLQSNDYDMVVITPSIFSDIVTRFISHKNSINVYSFQKNIEDIYNEFLGRDSPEKIKNYIKYAIEQYNIDFVLLIGDVNLLPIRKTELNWCYGDDVFVDDVITDLYYADIYDENGSFSSWDTNNDNIFSEFHWKMQINKIEYIDHVDLYPDVYIGRIPCSNKRELNIIVNKIISYETTTYEDNWFNRIILMGGDTFPYSKWPYPGCEIIEGEVVTGYIKDIMTNFEPILLWASNNSFSPFKINKAWNNGAKFISYSGHGFPNGFATSKPDYENSIKYLNLYLLGVNNKEKLPILFLDACLTAKIDYSINGINFPCFAWNALKKFNGGSIISIGATREAWEGYIIPYGSSGISFINIDFFRNYQNYSTPGEMLAQAQINYLNKHDWKDYLTIQEIILLGDPSLRIR